jgi:TRAP-type C4-dicarboxylate transport system permease small subunit
VDRRTGLAERIVGGGSRLLACISALAIFWLMGLTVIAVIMRYIFRAPILGAQDISQLSLVLVVFPAMAYCGWTGAHVALDLASSILNPSGLRWTDSLIRMTSGLLFLYVAWVTMVRGFDAFKHAEATNVIGIPYHPFFFVIALSSLTYAIVLFVQAVDSARGIPDTKES